MLRLFLLEIHFFKKEFSQYFKLHEKCLKSSQIHVLNFSPEKLLSKACAWKRRLPKIPQLNLTNTAFGKVLLFIYYPLLIHVILFR